jgi:hypothetical protein
MNGYINSSNEIAKLWNYAWLEQVMLGWLVEFVFLI